MPPKGKRPSGGGGGASNKKSKKATTELPAISPDNLRLPHMAIFDEWLFFGEIMKLGCQKRNSQNLIAIFLVLS